MSASPSRSGGFWSGLADSCDRLLPAAVAGRERDRQRRFLVVLFAAPFAFGGACAAILAQGGSSFLAALSVAGFALAWLAMVLVALNAGAKAVRIGALAAAAAGMTLLLAGAGGLSSPALLLAAALAFESWWIRREAAALKAGAAAAFAAVLAQPLIGAFPGLAGLAGEAAAWHWLLPAAYAAFAWPRLKPALVAPAEAGETAAPATADDLIDAVFLRAAGNGEISVASGRCEAHLGVAPSLLIGNGFFERLHVADRVVWLSALSDVQTRGGAAKIELRVRVAASSQSGARGYAPFSAEIHRCGKGELLVMLAGIGEVTDLRERLAAAREAADGSEIAKGRFLAAVSHELRTPLNAIIGFSDMLSHEMFGPFADPRQKEYAGLIREAGSHLLDVVNSILEVSKIESGSYAISPEPFSVSQAVQTCHAMLAGQAAAKGLRFEMSAPAALGEATADRRAVQQILINLLSNAVKFTPEGGTVKVAAWRERNLLVLEVSDDGIGIAEADLAGLGRPFMQVQNDYTRNFQGTGLGLALVKGLVALHRGSLSIESAPGEGTLVRVTLPADARDAAVPLQAKDAAHSPRRNFPAKEHGHATTRKTA